jgi:hypothetical protein
MTAASVGAFRFNRLRRPSGRVPSATAPVHPSPSR